MMNAFLRDPIHVGLWVVCALSLLCRSGSAFAKDDPGQAGISAELIQRLESGDGEPVKIVCFGDSVTGLYYHSGGQRTYTDMLGIALQQIYPQANLQMINAGISGHTTANALARIEKDVLARKPDLVTVMFGLNDVGKGVSIEGYGTNLGSIVAKCRAVGAEVVICTPNSVVSTESRPFEKLVKYCGVVREVAAKKRVVLCDTFTVFEAIRAEDPLAWRLTLSDEIHPNMAGHKVIAEQIAGTVSGRETSLDEVAPLQPAIDKSLALLAEGKPIKVLAMPPFDGVIEDALQALRGDAMVEVIPWPTEGMNLYQLRKDASHRVRKLKPNLVLIAAGRHAEAPDLESFIDDQYWLANYALSFGAKEWDVVVVHPSVFEGPGSAAEKGRDHLIRNLTAAHDLSLIDRAAGDERSAEDILKAWIAGQANVADVSAK